MGTNFYYHDDDVTYGYIRHIGKSSAGWCFSLHVYEEDLLLSLKDWIDLMLFPYSHIEDEYGNTLGIEDMLCLIVGRCGGWMTMRDPDSRWTPGYESLEDFYERNHAEAGPRGLLRHRIDGNCVGHGPGTWDLIKGDFS